MANQYVFLAVPASTGVAAITDLGDSFNPRSILLTYNNQGALTPGNGDVIIEGGMDNVAAHFAQVMTYQESFQGIRDFIPQNGCQSPALVRYVRVRRVNVTATDQPVPVIAVSSEPTSMSGGIVTLIGDAPIHIVVVGTAAEVSFDDAGVTTPKIADAAVTTAKLNNAAATGPKIATTAFTRVNSVVGHNGAGALTATGAKVGDVVLSVSIAKLGSVATTATFGRSAFETAVTVVDQIQQSGADDLSTGEFDFLLLSRT